MFPLRFRFVPGSIPKCAARRTSAAGASGLPARPRKRASFAIYFAIYVERLLSFRSRIISLSKSAFRASEEGIDHGGQKSGYA
jgi:hypothetical protein